MVCAGALVVDPVRYHLHARLFEGPLQAPTRNELQSDESDDFAAVAEIAARLTSAGFAVWIYEHGPVPTANGEGAYRVIAEWRPDGTRAR